MVHHPLPNCDPDDLDPLIQAFFVQGVALQDISMECRRKDLGFVTPRRREVELKGYLARWRRRVRHDAEAMQSLSADILATQDAMKRERTHKH